MYIHESCSPSKMPGLLRHLPTQHRAVSVPRDPSGALTQARKAVVGGWCLCNVRSPRLSSQFSIPILWCLGPSPVGEGDIWRRSKACTWCRRPGATDQPLQGNGIQPLLLPGLPLHVLPACAWTSVRNHHRQQHGQGITPHRTCLADAQLGPSPLLLIAISGRAAGGLGLQP